MTEKALLDIARQVPQYKRQELYDFARFLVEKYANTHNEERIAAFNSEDEMIDFINDVGMRVLRTLNKNYWGGLQSGNWQKSITPLD